MNIIDNRLPRIGALLAIASLITALGVPVTAMGKVEKVTICHAAGQDGTDHLVELNLAYQAVFGKAGHLNEDGTAQAGHEGDTLGPCPVTTPPTTTPPTTTPPTTTPPTTTPPTTTPPTTTPPTTTPPTTTPPTTVVDEVGAGTETTTPTTVPETVTTTTQPEDSDSIAAAATDKSGTAGGGGGEGAEIAAVETLPYTGMDSSLLLPASLLLMIGAVLVSVTGGKAAGAHAAGVDSGFGLGFYRGRHETSRWAE